MYRREARPAGVGEVEPVKRYGPSCSTRTEKMACEAYEASWAWCYSQKGAMENDRRRPAGVLDGADETGEQRSKLEARSHEQRRQGRTRRDTAWTCTRGEEDVRETAVVLAAERKRKGGRREWRR
jgi:hypothetical protein